MTTRATFKQDVESYLLTVGARRWTGPAADLLGYEFVLPTTLGELWVIVYDDMIACRWGNVKKALAAGLCVNPYTGKWNFHIATQHCQNAPTATLAIFQAEASSFLPPA
ncbi:MAG: hypothetical protein ABFC88_13190 [Thermoguttaceae bacterium]